MENLWIFTDGGAYQKGDGKYRGFSSFRIFNADTKELIHKNVVLLEEGTNQRAEITAMALAFEYIETYLEGKEDKEVHINLYTDSMLYYNSMKAWVFSWIKKARNGIFYSSSGEPVINQDMIKKAHTHSATIRKNGTIKYFHINSHITKKNVKKLKEKFQKFNQVQVSDEDFLFIYLQNANCDEMIKEANTKFIENNKPKNNILERLKEEI